MVWEEKPWEWTEEHQWYFNAIKITISMNACAGVDYDLQFYLATDVSGTGIGGVLFQLHGVLAGMVARPQHWPHERIIMFLSF